MAFGSIGSLGSGTSKTSNDSVSMATSAAAEADRLIVLQVAADNESSSDGETSEIPSVTDPSGNTWHKAAEYCNGQTAANAGATGAIWYSVISTEIDLGDAIIAFLATDKTAKCLTAWKFSKAPGSTVEVAGYVASAFDNQPAGQSLSISGLEPDVEHLFFRSTARERSFAGELFTPATDGWTLTDHTGTTGGVLSSNMSVGGEFLIATADNATSAPTQASAGDTTDILVALKEVLGISDPDNGGMFFGAVGI